MSSLSASLAQAPSTVRLSVRRRRLRVVRATAASSKSNVLGSPFQSALLPKDNEARLKLDMTGQVWLAKGSQPSDRVNPHPPSWMLPASSSVPRATIRKSPCRARSARPPPKPGRRELIVNGAWNGGSNRFVSARIGAASWRSGAVNCGLHRRSLAVRVTAR